MESLGLCEFLKVFHYTGVQHSLILKCSMHVTNDVSDNSSMINRKFIAQHFASGICYRCLLVMETSRHCPPRGLRYVCSGFLFIFGPSVFKLGQLDDAWIRAVIYRLAN